MREKWDEYIKDEREPTEPPSLRNESRCPRCGYKTVWSYSEPHPLFIDGDFKGDGDEWRCTRCEWSAGMHPDNWLKAQAEHGSQKTRKQARRALRNRWTRRRRMVRVK